jgi:hypothetical protein
MLTDADVCCVFISDANGPPYAHISDGC